MEESLSLFHDPIFRVDGRTRMAITGGGNALEQLEGT